MAHHSVAGASAMSRSRRLGVCLLVVIVALRAPHLRCSRAAVNVGIEHFSESSSHTFPHDDTTVTQTDKATKDPTSHTPSSTELSVPDAFPPSALMEQRRGFFGGLVVSGLIKIIKSLVVGVAEHGPKVLLKLVATDLAFHTEMRKFWKELQIFCTGTSSKMLATIYETYASWFRSQEAKPTYTFETFQDKITTIDNHVNSRCDTARNAVSGDTIHLLWRLAATKCSNACGELPDDITIPQDWLTGLTSFFPNSGASAALGTFCTDLWEEIQIILSECNIEVNPVDCSEIWALIADRLEAHAQNYAENYASEQIEARTGVNVETTARYASYVSRGVRYGGMAVGMYVAPGETISYLLMQHSNIEEGVKQLLAAQAEAMIQNKVLLLLPNKTTAMVEEYCQKALEVPDTTKMFPLP